MFEESKIKTELLDSTKDNNSILIKNKYGNNFDIILDDGLHTIEAQIKTFKNFWPLLKKNGIYLIEDIGNPELLKRELKKYTNKYIHIKECNIKISGDSYIIKIFK